MDKHAFQRACREGGAAIERTLRELDRDYFERLYREALHGLRDRDTALDLVQDTFIKVWQRCATFQADSEVFPWIKSILRNGLLDRLRREGREVGLENESGSTPELEARVLDLSTDTVPTPHDEARRGQLDECFRRCWQSFERAAPSHALVLSWIVEDGLDHQQIAAMLGRTPGATREFISQCRKRARTHLAEWYALASGVD